MFFFLLGADIDSQDNRKVSCLMAAFRKGHSKVVKWLVKHVTQFPSDTELNRFIATISDKVRLREFFSIHNKLKKERHQYVGSN
jgi:ankyrin repeat domain-containing protein 17